MLPAYQEALEDVALFDLSRHGRIILTGPDAGTFLHNLCTQDVKDLPVGVGAETFFCSATARIVAHGIVNHLSDHAWLIDTDAGQGEVLAKHLDHYLISEQVDIQDATPTWAQFRLVGPRAQSLLETALGVSLGSLTNLQLHTTSVEQHPAYVRRQSFLVLPSWDVFCGAETASSCWRRFEEGGAVPGSEAHDILRIEAGWPQFGNELDNNRFVVETGRIAQAISYSKGCYLGQEPIVMARDRGQVNRTLMGISFSSDTVVQPGTKLYHGDQDAGQVTSVVQSPRFGPIGLAYLRRGHQTPGLELTVESPACSVRATVAGLPFMAS